MISSFKNATLLSLLASSFLHTAEAQVTVVTGAREINGGSAVVLTYTVVNNSRDRMRDFHLRGSKKAKGTPQRSNNGTPNDRSDDYTASKKNGEVHWISTATNGGTPPGGTTTFSIRVDGMSLAEYQQNKQPVRWFATNDGQPHLDNPRAVIQQGDRDATNRPVEMALASNGMSVQPLDFGRVGQPLFLEVHAPEHAFADYVILCAFQESAGIPMAPGVHLPLALDPMLELSMLNVFLQPHPVFQNFAGPLDPLGSSQAALIIPPEPLLGGLELFTAGLTLDIHDPQLFVENSDATRIRINN